MMVRLLHSQKRERYPTHTRARAHTEFIRSTRASPFVRLSVPGQGDPTSYPPPPPPFFSSTERHHPFPTLPSRPATGKEERWVCAPWAGGRAGGGWWQGGVVGERERAAARLYKFITTTAGGDQRGGVAASSPAHTVHRRGRKGESTTRSTRLWGEGAIYSVRGGTVVINSGG